jgi:hypothetical protein
MNLILILVSAFSLQSQSVAPRAADPVLSAKIESLFETVLTSDDDNQEALASSRAKDIYTEHGLPTIATVGDQPAYEFVVLLASKRHSLEFRTQVLSKAKEAVARGDIPSDAAKYYEARLRLDKMTDEAKAHAHTNPAVRDEIDRTYKVDQAVRQQQGLDPKKMAEVDRQNAAPVQAILDKYGVSTFSMIGPEAAREFIDLIQHQPANFRQQVLPKLKANVAAGQADPESYALVYDRSQSEQGKTQLYGQNLMCKAGEKLHEAPMEDEFACESTPRSTRTDPFGVVHPPYRADHAPLLRIRRNKEVNFERLRCACCL